MPGSALLDLPLELLLHILDQLPITLLEKYRLAQSCHALHTAIIPMLLVSIINPVERSAIFVAQSHTNPIRGEEVDGFAILSLSFGHFMAFRHLTCSLPRLGRVVPPISLIRHLYRLAELVSRLSSIETVEIQLPYNLNDRETVADDDRLQQWCQVLGTILNGIIERSCTSLVVGSGWHMTRAFLFQRVAKLDYSVMSLIKRLKGVWNNTRQDPTYMKGDGWKFVRDPRQGKKSILVRLSPKAGKTSKLRRLEIKSTILLLPPCHTWTFSLIAASPLTSLSLQFVRLPREVWATTLQILCSVLPPSLHTLELSHCLGLVYSPFVRFVSALPHLATFVLDFYIWPNPDGVVDAQLVCPKLTTITVPDSFGGFFTQYPAALPKLRSVTVNPCCRHLPSIGYDNSPYFTSVTEFTLKYFDWEVGYVEVLCGWLKIFPNATLVSTRSYTFIEEQDASKPAWHVVNAEKVKEALTEIAKTSPGVEVLNVNGTDYLIPSTAA